MTAGTRRVAGSRRPWLGPNEGVLVAPRPERDGRGAQSLRRPGRRLARRTATGRASPAAEAGSLTLGTLPGREEQGSSDHLRPAPRAPPRARTHRLLARLPPGPGPGQGGGADGRRLGPRMSSVRGGCGSGCGRRERTAGTWPGPRSLRPAPPRTRPSTRGGR